MNCDQCGLKKIDIVNPKGEGWCSCPKKVTVEQIKCVNCGYAYMDHENTTLVEEFLEPIAGQMRRYYDALKAINQGADKMTWVQAREIAYKALYSQEGSDET